MSFKQDLIELQKNLTDFEKRYIDAVAVALLLEGYALDAVMVPLIPVRTGRTKSSHFVQPPQSTGFEPFVLVGVGTSYSPYLRTKGVGKTSGKKTKVPEKLSPSVAAASIRLKDDNFLKVAFDRRQSGYGPRLGKRVVQAARKGQSIGTIAARAPRRPQG